jgi:hypothetical protein
VVFTCYDRKFEVLVGKTGNSGSIHPDASEDNSRIGAGVTVGLYDEVTGGAPGKDSSWSVATSSSEGSRR